MQIKVTQGGIQDSKADTLVVNLFENTQAPTGATAAVDNALGGAIGELIANGDLTGKAGEVTVVYPRGAIAAKRVLVVGLGKPDGFNLDGVRKAAAAGMKKARDLKAKEVATIVHGGEGVLALKDAAQAVIEGARLAVYSYGAPGKNQEPKHVIDALTVIEMDEGKLEDVRAGVKAGEAITDAAILARDLVNMPPNVATPSKLADVARQIAQTYNLKITVGNRSWAAERQMGAFLAVALGATEEPQFIVLEHNAGRSDLDTVVIVGKGITFDSGGVSIKPAEKMGDMKSDMGGAAAVLSAMQAVAALNLPLHVVAITPATENMPDGGAYRPADVITASNGKTIEIISTDAEGRMILADALVFAQQYQPKAVVDLATLTGACVVALGEGIAAGLFCNDDSLRDRLLEASKATEERLWPMPLWDLYKKSIKTDVADMKNSGGRMSGVASSAVFLKEFTDYPWAHLDIAGMALQAKEDGYLTLGGTGFGTRLLVEFLRNWK